MKTIRRMAELWSRGKLLKRRIIVDGKAVPLFVSPDAQLKYLKPGTKSFDQDLINIAEKYLALDSNVWDIGANVGVFTFASASIAREGNIVSVEADTWLVDVLRKTASLAQYSNGHICILPTAVSHENSVASFLVADRGRASNTLEATSGSRSQTGGFREKQFVPTLTMDTLLGFFPSPDFIKIDIEGAEYMALQGASKVINEVRPIFYIEVGGETSHQIFETFNQAKYSAFDKTGEELKTASAFNIFFVPNEKVEAFCTLAPNRQKSKLLAHEAVKRI